MGVSIDNVVLSHIVNPPFLQDTMMTVFTASALLFTQTLKTLDNFLLPSTSLVNGCTYNFLPHSLTPVAATIQGAGLTILVMRIKTNEVCAV